jgi:hypothetical protein
MKQEETKGGLDVLNKSEKIMIKILTCAALITAALTATSFAADTKAKCDEATMTMVMDAMKKDTDPKMAKDVEMAASEMKMAAASMKDKKMDDCSMHIDAAKKHMMMK